MQRKWRSQNLLYGVHILETVHQRKKNQPFYILMPNKINDFPFWSIKIIELIFFQSLNNRFYFCRSFKAFNSSFLPNKQIGRDNFFTFSLLATSNWQWFSCFCCDPSASEQNWTLLVTEVFSKLKWFLFGFEILKMKKDIFFILTIRHLIPKISKSKETLTIKEKFYHRFL